MTTDELRNAVIEYKHALTIAKERLAKRLLEEFPAQAGDIVTHREGVFLISRISPRYDGPSVYVRKRKKDGEWSLIETTISGLSEGISSGIFPISTEFGS